MKVDGKEFILFIDKLWLISIRSAKILKKNL